MLSEDKKY